LRVEADKIKSSRIVHQMDARREAVSLFFFRIGSATYWRKGATFD